jgi:hypothetical protein
MGGWVCAVEGLRSVGEWDLQRDVVERVATGRPLPVSVVEGLGLNGREWLDRLRRGALEGDGDVLSESIWDSCSLREVARYPRREVERTIREKWARTFMESAERSLAAKDVEKASALFGGAADLLPTNLDASLGHVRT